MTLPLLDIDSNYFTNLKQQRQKLKSIFFDNQFKIISDYINKKLIPYVNIIVDGRIPGTTDLNSIGKYARFAPRFDDDNVLISNYIWDSVNSNDFEDNSIPYIKLNQAPTSSVICSDTDGSIISISPNEEYQVLVSRLNNPPFWRKLTGDDLPDRVIKGNMIAKNSLPADAFVPGELLTQVLDGTITTSKFPDKSITNPKIADGAIDERIMGNFILNNFINNINSQFIPDDSINLSLVPIDKLKNLQFFNNFGNLNGAEISRIFDNKPWEPRVFKPLNDASLLAPKSITGDKIDDEIIPANLLQFYVTPNICLPGIRNLIDFGAIEIEHLDNEMKAYLHLI